MNAPNNSYVIELISCKKQCYWYHTLLIEHEGNSKGTTCVVDRDVTAYLVVDRVLRLPTEQYGCRYEGYPVFNDVKVDF